MIRTNVADLVDKPKRERYEGAAYSIKELNGLFKAARGSAIEATILLASFYGLRRSEVLGLTWGAIDFESKVITIRQKVIRGHDDTLLVHLGFHMKDVQEWLGHSDFLITANTYTHVNMEEKIQMIDSVANMLNI